MPQRPIGFRGLPLRSNFEILELRRLLSGGGEDNAAIIVDLAVPITAGLDVPMGPAAPTAGVSDSAASGTSDDSAAIDTVDTADTDALDAGGVVDDVITPSIDVAPPVPVTDETATDETITDTTSTDGSADSGEDVSTDDSGGGPLVAVDPVTTGGDDAVTPVDPIVNVDPVTPIDSVVDVDPITPVDPIVNVDPITPVDPVVVLEPPTDLGGGVVDPTVLTPVDSVNPDDSLAVDDLTGGLIDGASDDVVDDVIDVLPPVDVVTDDGLALGDDTGVDTGVEILPAIDFTGDVKVDAGDLLGGDILAPTDSLTPTDGLAGGDLGGDMTIGDALDGVTLIDISPIDVGPAVVIINNGNPFTDTGADMDSSGILPSAQPAGQAASSAAQTPTVSSDVMAGSLPSQWHPDYGSQNSAQNSSSPTRNSGAVLAANSQEFTGSSSKGTFSESPIGQSNASSTTTTGAHSTPHTVVAAPGSVATGDAASNAVAPTLSAPTAVAPAIDADALTDVQTVQLGQAAIVDGTEDTGLAAQLDDRKFGPVAAGGEMMQTARHRTITRAMVRVETLSAMVVADPEEPQAAAAPIASVADAGQATVASSFEEGTAEEQVAAQRQMASIATTYQPEPANVHNIMAAALAGATFIAIHWHRWRKRRMEAASAAASKLGNLLRFDPLAAWIDDNRRD